MANKLLKAFHLAREARRYRDATFYGGPKILQLAANNYRSARLGYRSQAGQDLIALEHLLPLLHDPAFPRVAVDVGCNHPTLHNNTYLVEKYFGFRTVAIDPIEEFRSEWAVNRPSAEFICTAVGSTVSTAAFNVAQGEPKQVMLSSIKGYSKKLANVTYAERTVPVRPLRDLLAERQVSDIGLLSIDVEGFELDVLRGIDFSRARIRVILIENNSQQGRANEAIRRHLLASNYSLVARIHDLDDIYIARSDEAHIGL